MNLDLITAIELTASASVIIATTALLLGRTTRIRFAITGALVLWFAWAVGLAASSFFSPNNPFGLPGLGLSVGLPIFLLVFAVSRIGALKEALRGASLTSLVALNILRVLGLGFLLLEAQGRVAPTFALSAGWGDVSVGLLAIPLSWALANRRSNLRGLVWLWNSLGLLDLITAVTLAVMSSPGPLHVIVEHANSNIMTTLPWFLIPGYLVPLFASSHLAIFWRLKHLEERAPSHEKVRGSLSPAL